MKSQIEQNGGTKTRIGHGDRNKNNDEDGDEDGDPRW